MITRPLCLALLLASTQASAQDRPLPLTSKPTGATVLLDGVEVGTTPMTVNVPPGDKHVLVVTKPGFSKITKTLSKLKPSDKLDVELVDTELAAAKALRVKAQARYDKANAKLESLQAAVESKPEPSAKLLRDLDNAEVAMQKEAERLETVEADVRRLEQMRRTDAERADEARKLSAIKNAPPAPQTKTGIPTFAKPPVEAPMTVVCTFDEPGEGDKFTIHSYCTEGPLSQAVSTCNVRAGIKRATKGCTCSDDKALVAGRCH